MAKQTFTTGQVLTAAQMTSLQANDYNWSVNAQTASYTLVAADAGKQVTMNNAGATTITVNTALFTASDTLRITNIGAGTCTITAGTATVSSAGSLALTQYASGILYFSTAAIAIFFPDAKTVTGSGLAVVKAETSFSASATISADSVFTSGYTNYRIMVNCYASGAATTMRFQLRTGGIAAATNYNANWIYISGGAVTVYSASATTEIQIGSVDASPVYTNFAFDVFAPQLAQQTNLTGQAYKGGNLYTIGGSHTTATAYDGFQLYATAGPTFTGTYTVYGYGKS